MLDFTSYTRGDWLGLIGIGISLLGFIVAIWQIRKTQTAAKSALDATKTATESIKKLDSVINFSNVSKILSEIKLAVRNGNTDKIVQLFDEARTSLILARENAYFLTTDDRGQIQKYLASLTEMELDFVKGGEAELNMKKAKFTRFIIRASDDIAVMLTRTKSEVK